MIMKEFAKKQLDARREPARRLVRLAVALAIAVAIIGLIGHYMQTSGLQF